MGSQRRILSELEDQGITGELADDALEAIEILNAAGDELSDALFPFLEYGDSEKSLKLLNEALAHITSAVATISATVSPKN